MAMLSAELGQPAPGDVEDRGNGMISATFPITGLPQDAGDQEQWLAVLEQSMNRRVAFDAQLLVGSNFPARIHIGGSTETLGERVQLLRDLIAETNESFGDPDARRLDPTEAEQAAEDAQVAKNAAAFDAVSEALRDTET
jgi:hypothetical protein